MKRLLVGMLAAGVLLAPLAIGADDSSQKNTGTSNTAMSKDMREAIAFERAKDRADARQARLEAKHPSVAYENANRSADRTDENTVKDRGPAPAKKDQ